MTIKHPHPEWLMTTGHLSGNFSTKTLKCLRCSMVVERDDYGLMGSCSGNKLKPNERVEVLCGPCVTRVLQFIEDGI